MEPNNSLGTGPGTLGWRFSVKGRLLSGGVILNADTGDVANPLAPVDVGRVGLGVKVGAKGLSGFEGDVSGPTGAPKGNPSIWGVFWVNNAGACDGRST